MPSEMGPVKPTPFMSVVEGRTPRQKTHVDLNHAKSAFATSRFNELLAGTSFGYTHSWGSIYELVGGEWELRMDIPKPEPKDYFTKVEYGYTVRGFETRPWKRKP